MAVDTDLTSINTKLAKAVGYVEKLEKGTKNIGANTSSVNKGLSSMAGVGGTSTGVGGGKTNGGGAAFSTPTPGRAGGGGSSGSGSTSTSSGSQSSGNNGNLLAGSLAAVGAVASAGWQMVPGVRDYAASQASLFPTAFGMQGQYSNTRAAAAIRAGIGQGSSGIFDAKAAAAMGSVSGLSFNLGGARGGTALGNALGGASFAYQMMGMNNQSAMAGQVGMVKGTGQVSGTLAKIGIFTADMNSGKPKDMGQIVDELWVRFYGSKTAKITMEQFDADLLMGFLGADLQTMFGSQPELYAQIVSFMRVKVKANGRAGMRVGSGGISATGVARGLGLTASNTPTIKAGEVSSARNATLDTGSAAGMSGYNTAQDAIVNMNSGLQELYKTLDPLSEWMTSFKSFLDAFGSSSEGSSIMGLVSGALKAVTPGGAMGFAIGGGNSTSDSINAKLSKGEYVINARAAQRIGVKNLDALNSTGHSFGSAYASPVRNFATGGSSLDTSASGAVSWAASAVGGKQTYPNQCDHFVALAYGLANSNYPTAASHWDQIPAEYRHPGDTNPPPGALVFWSASVGGGAGHAAIVSGKDQSGRALITTTHTNNGHPEQMPLDGVMTSAYLGWAVPYFHGKTAVVDGTAAVDNPAASPTDGSNEAARTATKIRQSALGAKSSMNAAYTSIMGTSLAGLGKAGAAIGRFTAGYVDASAVGNNAAVLATNARTSPGGAIDLSGITLTTGVEPAGAPAANSSPTSSAPGAAASKSQLIGWLRSAGFSGEHLREAWAIAMRESTGHPTAHNVGPKDDSYGLFQINFKPVGGLDPKKREESLRKNVAGYNGRESLLDPTINARAAYYMSGHGSNWASWVGPHFGKADQYYDQYAASASQGMQSTHAGILNVHEGEVIIPASQANDFREALREALSGGRGGAKNIDVHLHIEKTSHEEAVRFAREVKMLIEDDARAERLGSR